MAQYPEASELPPGVVSWSPEGRGRGAGVRDEAGGGQAQMGEPRGKAGKADPCSCPKMCTALSPVQCGVARLWPPQTFPTACRQELSQSFFIPLLSPVFFTGLNTA